MRSGLISLTALLLLLSSVLACSMLRAKKSLTWQVKVEVEVPGWEQEAATEKTIDMLRERLNAVGVHDFDLQPQGAGRILVKLPEVSDKERLKKFLFDQGKLELLHVISPPSPAAIQTYETKEEAIAALNNNGNVPDNRRVLSCTDRFVASRAPNGGAKWVIVESPPIVDGNQLRSAAATAPTSRNDQDGYGISFSLKKAGAETFGAWTGSHINEYVGVALNDEVKSIAYIKSQIYDQGEISGRFTKETADDLALLLKSGALPAPVKILEEGPIKN